MSLLFSVFLSAFLLCFIYSYFIYLLDFLILTLHLRLFFLHLVHLFIFLFCLNIFLFSMRISVIISYFIIYLYVIYPYFSPIWFHPPFLTCIMSFLFSFPFPHSPFLFLSFHFYIRITSHKTKKKAHWTGHILRRNCLLKHVTEEKINVKI